MLFDSAFCKCFTYFCFSYERTEKNCCPYQPLSANNGQQQHQILSAAGHDDVAPLRRKFWFVIILTFETGIYMSFPLDSVWQTGHRRFVLGATWFLRENDKLATDGGQFVIERVELCIFTRCGSDSVFSIDHRISVESVTKFRSRWFSRRFM